MNEEEIETWYEEAKQAAMDSYKKKLELLRKTNVPESEKERKKLAKKQKPLTPDQLKEQEKLYERDFLKAMDGIHAKYDRLHQEYKKRLRKREVLTRRQRIMFYPFLLIIHAIAWVVRKIKAGISSVKERIKKFLREEFSFFMKRVLSLLSFKLTVRTRRFRVYYVWWIKPGIRFFWRPMKKTYKFLMFLIAKVRDFALLVKDKLLQLLMKLLGLVMRLVMKLFKLIFKQAMRLVKRLIMKKGGGGEKAGEAKPPAEVKPADAAV